MLKCGKFLLCFGLSIFLLGIQNGLAYNDDTLDMNLHCDNSSPASGEEFTVSLNFLPSESINVSAYRLKVNFDSAKIAYKGLYSNVNNDDFYSYISGGNLTILYVTSENGVNIRASNSTTVVELNFKVLSSCDIGTSQISAKIDGLCDYDAVAIPLPEIDPITVNVTQSGEGNCDLAALSASEYQLVPAFSSDITNYSVEVPYSKSTMEFEAAPSDENATVKVSRKTLKSAGTSTDINLTVTSADKKSKKVYTVSVNRLSKEASGQISTLNTLAESKLTEDTYEEESTDLETVDQTDLNFDEEMLDDSLQDDFTKNNEIALQKASAPLIVKENSFNWVVFLSVTIACVVIAIFVLKRPQNNPRHS